MNREQYNDIKTVINMKLDSICRVLKNKVDTYDIDESMDICTLTDMVSDTILEIGEIKEFMDKF